MNEVGSLAAAAFTLLIGGQFLAAVFVVSNRQSLYPDPQHSAEQSQPARFSIASHQQVRLDDVQNLR